MSLDIKITRIERVVIECPMEEAKDAIAWLYDNGYGIARGGWSGPALAKEDSDNMLDQTRYHTEGEKEIKDSVIRGYTGLLGIRIEGSDGVIREVSSDQFYCTGMAPTISDLKSGRVNRSELGTIGYFRHPDGHLCESSLYDKYVGGET